MFNDVGKDDWYYNSVISAYDKGIVTGDANGSFNPNTEITRQEMAAIIYRAMVAAEINADTVRSVNLTDKESIDDWAYMPVTQLVNMGIVNGYEDGAFKPFNSATREEAAKLIYEVMNIAKKLNGGVVVKKQIASLILAFVMMGSVPQISMAAPDSNAELVSEDGDYFTDIKNHWANTEINSLASEKIVSGSGETFLPRR